MEYKLSTTWTIIFILVAVWELVWKGMALWKAGRNNQPGWFVALIVINSAGLLPMFYLFTQQNKQEG